MHCMKAIIKIWGRKSPCFPHTTFSSLQVHLVGETGMNHIALNECARNPAPAFISVFRQTATGATMFSSRTEGKSYFAWISKISHDTGERWKAKWALFFWVEKAAKPTRDPLLIPGVHLATGCSPVFRPCAKACPTDQQHPHPLTAC